MTIATVKENEIIREICIETGSDSIMVIIENLSNGKTRHAYIAPVPSFAADPEYLVRLLAIKNGLVFK